jgi:hypothetical protein
MGSDQFQRVIDKQIEDKHNVLSAFQLYKINENNPTRAAIYKEYIMNKYPNSDYANYLRDPDYFVKKKQMHWPWMITLNLLSVTKEEFTTPLF